MKKLVIPKGRTTAVKILWSGFRPMYDYWGNELKRFYKFDTLVSSVSSYLETKDKFINDTIHSVMGPAQITSLKFHLFQEGKYQFIFKLTAENKKLKKANFAFVVAKDGNELTKTARIEHNILKKLHLKCPQFVVKPYGGDYLFFPDRHGRKEFHRNIYAYMTEWLSGYEELGINKDLQFYTNVLSPHTFSVSETNNIKIKIMEIILSLYNQENEESIVLPEIASGDFVIKRSPSKNHKLKMIACRGTLKRITLEKLISLFLTTSWKWGNRKFTLLPDNPHDIVRTLVKIFGKEKTIIALNNLWNNEKNLLKNLAVPYEYVTVLKKSSIQ
ncbi:MAG: hypothetical protein N3G21_04175 [Candidatus Hydrogenedentes bacterium]|nr:hypothetical protein [Candidatus Hydrogenedentota bacterium]